MSVAMLLHMAQDSREPHLHNQGSLDQLFGYFKVCFRRVQTSTPAGLINSHG